MTTILRDAQAALDEGKYELVLALTAPLATSAPELTAKQKASLHSLRAQSCFRLDRFPEAAKERALEIVCLEASSSDPAFVESIRYALAWALYQSSSFQAALENAARVYLFREANLGASDPKTLLALTLCVDALDKLGNGPASLSLAEELHERRLNSPGATDVEIRGASMRLERARAASVTGALPIVVDNPRIDVIARPNPALAASTGRVAEILYAVTSGTARGAVRGLIEGLLG